MVGGSLFVRVLEAAILVLFVASSVGLDHREDSMRDAREWMDARLQDVNDVLFFHMPEHVVCLVIIGYDSSVDYCMRCDSSAAV